MRRFFAWSADKRRNPYAKRTVLVTPCGTKHPDVEKVVRSRWLELVEATEDEIAVDAIVLHGPAVAQSDDDLKRQTYSLVKRYWDGARMIAENMGGNRFCVKVENVKRFVIYVSPKMGDVTKPFAVDFGNGHSVSAIAGSVTGDIDYTAKLEVVVP